MKPWTLFLLALFLMNPRLPAASPRATSWEEVRAAMNQGQPRTALERLQPLLAAATAAEDWSDTARAIALRITLEAGIEGGLPEERITRYQTAIPLSPEPVRPILQTLLAHSFWAYFDQNRWRIQQRTTVPEDAIDTDFRTWDLRRLFGAIDETFQSALAQPEVLRSMPISRFDGLLEPGTMPDRYRPTLYDFLAHQAMTFYAAGEQAGARPEDAFYVTLPSPALAPRAEFLAWTPVTTDTNSVAFKAIRLFQDLIRSHLNDVEPSALLDADLARLRMLGNLATGPEREDRLAQSLEAFAGTHTTHELSALALHAAADLRRSQQQLADAHHLASRGVRAFPESAGGRLCANLIRVQETPHLRVQAEHVWCAPWPELALHHSQLRQAHFRVVSANWNQFLDRRRNRPEQMRPEERMALLREAAVHAWTTELPATPDFKERETRVTVPAHLPPGFYFLLSSQQPDFGVEGNEVLYTPFWVSDLALVVQTRGTRFQGWVLDAREGTPKAGAKVEAWALDERGQRMPLPPVTTGADGAFSFGTSDESGRSRGHLFKATWDRQTVASFSDVYGFDPGAPPHQVEQTHFFTDRALYRPGQNIHYKGLCIRGSIGDRTYSTISNRTVSVVFRDANGNEVARAAHRANDFGSFSGSFTAPRGGLTGSHSISIEDGPVGSHGVQVEEYKRPKFETVLEPARQGGHLDAEVTVPGRATTYAGTPVDSAKVRWTVRRQPRFPPWWAWRSGPLRPDRGQQEIAHGEGFTKSDGSFDITFVARPDPDATLPQDASFVFSITADVTDAAGETRSASRSVRFGHAALEIDCPVPEWMTASKEFPLRITTRSLDDLPVSARGTVRVHRLKQPDRVQRPSVHQDRSPPLHGLAQESRSTDLTSWPLGELVTERTIQTLATNGMATVDLSLPAGPYRALVQFDDGQGRTVTAQSDLVVRDPEAAAPSTRLAFEVAAPRWNLEPGSDFVALWNTGYETGRAVIQVEHRRRIVHQIWTEAGRTQQKFAFPVTEAMRGGFTLHVFFVRENRWYTFSRRVDVPWSNQQLRLAWSSFRTRVEPGQKETWSIAVTPPTGSTALPAEMVATLYDASLDQFLPVAWPDGFGIFEQDYATVQFQFGNHSRWMDRVHGRVREANEGVRITYRGFPAELVQRGGAMYARRFSLAAPMPAVMMAEAADAPADAFQFTLNAPAAAGVLAGTGGGAMAKGAVRAEADAGRPAGPPAAAAPSLRRNLQETAFFLPHLISDSDGTMRLEFQFPDTVTRWRFLGFAHDRQLRAGLLEGQAVAARDLMVLPNPPRFVREGDEVEFSARVVNKSDQPQRGTARLQLTFATGPSAGADANAALGIEAAQQPFDLPAGATRAVAWRIKVPDGAGFLAYEVSAQGERHRDGEAGVIPVLARRVLLTESLPLPVRGEGARTFTFEALRDAARSPTLTHERVTVEMASNPAWYAVLALPVLMEFPHECAEQTFNRLYANELGHTLTTRDPRIARTFELWRNTPALQSPLEKNEDLKAVALAETPWVRDAKSESETRRNIGLLFDTVRLRSETDRALRRLSEMALPEGGWPWFPGGPFDEFITLYLVAGFGHLQQLGVDLPLDLPMKALPALDRAMHERWERLQREKLLDRAHLSPHHAFYLYARSLFLPNHPLAQEHRESFTYWVRQAEEHWLKLDHRLPQGHVALALHRLRATDTVPGLRAEIPAAIARSLHERSVHHEELGRYWREDEFSASWFRAPIETQALMIEVFATVAEDAATVEELKVWLLKQKQTQGWKSTKATADAVYALLRRGADLLADTALVQVSVGGRGITPAAGTPGAGTAVEPGTGYFQKRFDRGEITPELARVDVRKPGPGVAWGAVHWQYFEDLSQVRAHAGTPLKLEKALFRKVRTAAGDELRPADGRAAVGDELVVRVTLRTDRDLEYVHLKDQRGSGTEPVNVLSGYRFQDGLGYYESTRDTASHFFISYLPKGTYVFEYPVRVQLRGRYATGVAEVQCMYAPEFNSHSAGAALSVE